MVSVQTQNNPVCQRSAGTLTYSIHTAAMLTGPPGFICGWKVAAGYPPAPQCFGVSLGDGFKSSSRNMIYSAEEVFITVFLKSVVLKVFLLFSPFLEMTMVYWNIGGKPLCRWKHRDMSPTSFPTAPERKALVCVCVCSGGSQPITGSLCGLTSM